MQVHLRWLTATFAALLTTFALGATTAPAASAAGFRCDAQALRADLLGSGLLGTGVAGATADTACPTQTSGVGLNVPGVATVGAVSASTAVVPSSAAGADQTATSHAQAADVAVALPAVPVVTADAVEATATARCDVASGTPTLTASSRVTGLTVLGQQVNIVDPTLEQVIPLTGALGAVATVEINTSATEGGRLVRRAVRVRVLSGLGASLADVTIGRAAVGAGDVDCTTASPQVTLTDPGANRRIAASVVLAPGRTLAGGSFAVRPVGSSDAPTPVTATVVGTTLTATLPRGTFPAGTYELVATATDDLGHTGSASGQLVVAAPAVGSPVFTGREVSAAATAPAGTSIADCDISLTPAGGGAAVDLDGTYDSATQRCVATAPDVVPAGDHTASVTATDSNGDVGTGTATGALGAVASGPTVALLPGATNRVVVAQTTPGAGGAATACTISAGPVGGTAVDLNTTFDPQSGRCAASLPASGFPAGATYAVAARATDAAGHEGSAAGVAVVGRPFVGPPVAAGRRVVAAVAPASGVGIASCSVAVGPVGGTPRDVGGTYDASAGTCAADVPDDVPAGLYALTVGAVDTNGDRGSASGAGTIGGDVPTGRAPAVTFLDGQANRRVAARVVVDPTRTVRSCTILATPAGGGATAPVPATYDAASGECRGVLSAATYPQGEVRVSVVATDSAGESGAASGSVRIALPEIGTPTVDGGTVTVPVTPADGTTITACTLTLATGSSPAALDAAYDAAAGTCSAPVPAGTPAGEHELTVTATDSDGAQASETSTVTIPAGAGAGDGGGDGDGAGGGNGADGAGGAAGAGGAGAGGAGSTGNANSQSAAQPGAGTAPNFATASTGDLLTCGVNRLLLTEVQQVGGRVRLVGAAESGLVGKEVKIMLGSSRVPVARATVSRDGVFSTSASLPAKRLRGLRTTRYQAVSGTVVSKRLKLQRRLSLTRLAVRGGSVTIRGRAVAPLARKRAVVRVQQLVSCGTYRTVRTTRLSRTGAFATSVKAPAAVAAVYRVSTSVARRPGGRATFRTFTLPAGLRLKK